MSRPPKRSRETRRLIDALGGGLETTAPRSARTARKLPRLTSTRSSSPHSNTTTNHHHHHHHPLHHRPKELAQKHSDSSLSELSDTFEPPLPSLPLPQTFQSQPSPAPSSSLPSTPSINYPPANMKPPKNNTSSLRRKTIIKRSNTSLFRPSTSSKPTPNRTQRNRKLTDTQKRELEQTKIKLLENLEKEEELIKTSRHPILVSLEENVSVGREIKLNQAREKFNRLLNYLHVLHVERQQRIWATWIDKKIRLRNEMIVDCQIRLNRAPFEFLISNDTTNLQAIFHLTPTPAAPYNRPKLSVNQEAKGLVVDETRSLTGASSSRSSNLRQELVVGGSNWNKMKTEENNQNQYDSRKKKEEIIIDNYSGKNQRRNNNTKSTINNYKVVQDHQHQSIHHPPPPLPSVDLIHGLIHHKIRSHNVWKLSRHDVDHDLNLIKKIKVAPP